MPGNKARCRSDECAASISSNSDRATDFPAELSFFRKASSELVFVWKALTIDAWGSCPINSSKCCSHLIAIIKETVKYFFYRCHSWYNE